MPTAVAGILRILRDRIAPVWTVVADFFSPGRFGAPGSSGSLLHCREILSADQRANALELRIRLFTVWILALWCVWLMVCGLAGPFRLFLFSGPSLPPIRDAPTPNACGSLLVAATLLVPHSTFDGRVFIGGG